MTLNGLPDLQKEVNEWLDFAHYSPATLIDDKTKELVSMKAIWVGTWVRHRLEKERLEKEKTQYLKTIKDSLIGDYNEDDDTPTFNPADVQRIYARSAKGQEMEKRLAELIIINEYLDGLIGIVSKVIFDLSNMETLQRLMYTKR